MRVKTVVEFSDLEDAAAYLGDSRNTSWRAEAVRYIADRCGGYAGVPGYISGSTPDKVYPVSTMPTRYIRNVLNMTDERIARGIRRELEAELQRRTDRDGSLRDS